MSVWLARTPGTGSYPEAMSDATILPTWLLIGLAVGTPVLTFIGVALGNLATRKGVVELETRSKREETMRTLKWAAELAVSDDPTKADLGLRQLEALGESAMLDTEQQTFIDAALASVYAEPEAQIAAAEVEGDDVEVVLGVAELSGEGTLSAGGTPGPAPSHVSSESDEENEGRHG